MSNGEERGATEGAYEGLKAKPRPMRIGAFPKATPILS